MFNAEKLLGKVISEAVGSGLGKRKRRKGQNVLIGKLTSGAGLMTAIGLGVGAFEILKEKKQQQHPPTPPPLPPANTAATPPPPPPAAESTPPQQPVGPTTALDTEELAMRMIRVMIGAAHADGTMDEQEEKAIFDQLKATEITLEEKMFLLDELHHPKAISELTADIDDPSVAKAMYMLAVATIAIDTAEERQWLDQLAGGLGLSKAVQDFIEEEG